MEAMLERARDRRRGSRVAGRVGAQPARTALLREVWLHARRRPRVRARPRGAARPRDARVP
jgi:hypothetical protein